MIIKKSKELTNYFSQRLQYFQGRGRLSVQLRNPQKSLKQFNKTGSISMLDSKKIKSRLCQILKQDKDLKVIQRQTHKQQKNKRTNKLFNKTFLRKRQKQFSSNHIPKQKMQIVNLENIKLQNQSPFQIKQMKLKRKGNHFNFSIQKQNIQQIYADRYYRVLSFAKSRFTANKIYRKPSIPENFRIQEHKNVLNNFLKTKKQFHKQRLQKSPLEKLQPWQKLQEHQVTEYDI